MDLFQIHPLLALAPLFAALVVWAAALVGAIVVLVRERRSVRRVVHRKAGLVSRRLDNTGRPVAGVHATVKETHESKSTDHLPW